MRCTVTEVRHGRLITRPVGATLRTQWVFFNITMLVPAIPALGAQLFA